MKLIHKYPMRLQFFVLGTALLPWGFGCATSMVSEQTRKNPHIHYVFRDRDRVHEIRAAAWDGEGNLFVLYHGAHGQDYERTYYVMRIPARRLRQAQADAGSDSPLRAGVVSRSLVVSRRHTQDADALPSTATNPATVAVYGRHSGSYPDFLQKFLPGPAVVHQQDRTMSGLRDFLKSPKADTPALGVAVVLPPEEEGKPPVHLSVCTPWKRTHDFSGAKWHLLYPVALAWDVVTSPVQAAAVVWFFATWDGSMF